MAPRADYPWMQGGGEMGRIMSEMHDEMTLLMMPTGMDPAGHARMMAAMQAKMMRINAADLERRAVHRAGA